MVHSSSVLMVRKIASVNFLAVWTLTTVMQTSSYVHRSGPHSASDRVRLENVKVLTLYESRQTTGRRSAPLPQLACQGGCGSWTPSTVQCYNMGSDGRDAAWKCEASMPEGYSFSSIEVGCEGYDYPEDPYILKDSCQLVYSLSVPRRDRHSYATGAHESWDGREPVSRGSEGGSRGFGSRLVQWAVLGIVGYVLYNVFVQTTSSGRPSPPPGGTGGTGGTGGGSGGGGGGGGGGGSGYGGGDNWRGGHRDDSSNTKSSSAAAPAPDAARDGWMSMLGAGGIGAALGYMMRPRQPRNAPRGSNAWNQGYGTGTFGGGGYRPRSPGGGGGGGGTGMRMRAGYGGTSRR